MVTFWQWKLVGLSHADLEEERAELLLKVRRVVGDDVLLPQVHLKHKPLCREGRRETEMTENLTPPTTPLR
jgi:hypothetical protein